VPAKVGPHALNDASGRYFGQSLSGYGIMWNSDYLRQRQIREPQEWQDLAQPAYAGHVVLSAPSRSGTTHLMVESMLQGLGWEQGWALLLQLAGNAAEISPDSYAVPRGIARGSYGAGLVIDAFGLAAKYSGMPVDFAYATMAPVLPASIGLVAGAHNPDGAKRFMAFTLSPPGQQLLLDPGSTACRCCRPRCCTCLRATGPLPAGPALAPAV
jgi:ABC-type Fe3+ transport system substrate-binding protein